MAKTTDEPVNGRLDLIDYFHESASSHVDTTRQAKLVPYEQTSVMLETYYDHNNVYEASTPATSSKWVIGRDDLIKLIQQHGQRVA